MARHLKWRLKSVKNLGEKIAWSSTVLLGFGSVSVIIFTLILLNPPQNRPEIADAVVVIAGASDGRHELAVELIESGVADNLVVSNPAGAKDEIGFSLCQGRGLPENINVWCMKPNPVTTTGEARTFEDLAKNKGWKKIVAVTNRPHHYRVRLNFIQCTNVDTVIVASTEKVAWRVAPYLTAREFGGYVKYFLSRPC